MTPMARSQIHSLSLMAMAAIMSIMMISPVISILLDHRGLPTAQVGLVIGVMSLALILAEVLALGVTARLGRRVAVIISLAGSALMLAWFPLTVSLAGMYLTRLLLGAVRGLLWPVLFAEVAEQVPPDRRAPAFALFWLYFGVGQLIGPALGGVLGEQLSLEAPFFAAALVAAVTLPLVSAVRPLRDTSARNPVDSYRVLRKMPAVTRVWTLTVCNVIVYAVYLAFLPLHAQNNGISPTEIGLIFSAGAVAFSLGQWLIGRMSDRVPAARLLVPAFLARGLSVAAIPLLASFWSLLLVNFVASVISAAIPPALSTRIADAAPREHLVAAMGGFNASADAGFFIGPVLGGLVAAYGLQWAFVMTLPVTAASLLLLRSPHMAPTTAKRAPE